MNIALNIGANLLSLLSLLWHRARYLCRFLLALLLPKALLAAKLLVAESQLAVSMEHFSRKKKRRPRPWFRSRCWADCIIAMSGWRPRFAAVGYSLRESTGFQQEAGRCH